MLPRVLHCVEQKRISFGLNWCYVLNRNEKRYNEETSLIQTELNQIIVVQLCYVIIILCNYGS